MGIIFTRYEDEANNNILFDSSKFDYSYDGDTFSSDAATDFDNVLLEIGQVYNVERPSDTEDAMGDISDTSNSSFRIYAIKLGLTKKDRLIHNLGIAVTGIMKMYLKPVYIITSGGVDTEYVVKEGDIFIDGNSKKWKVIKIIHEPEVEQEQIYKKAIVQSINLGGSE